MLSLHRAVKNQTPYYDANINHITYASVRNIALSDKTDNNIKTISLYNINVIPMFHPYFLVPTCHSGGTIGHHKRLGRGLYSRPIPVQSHDGTVHLAG